jgi:hypothetical protein
MATNGLQDLVLPAKEKRCERAVGWKVNLKNFSRLVPEGTSYAGQKAVILKMVDMVGFPEGTTLS